MKHQVLYDLFITSFKHRRQRDSRAISSNALLNNKAEANGDINSSTHSEGEFYLYSFHRNKVKINGVQIQFISIETNCDNFGFFQVMQVVTVIPVIATFVTQQRPLVVFVCHPRRRLLLGFLQTEEIIRNIHTIKAIRQINGIIIIGNIINP